VTKKPTIAIIGAGALAHVLAPSFCHAGYKIEEIVARDAKDSKRHALQLVKSCDARAATITTAKLDAQIIWICVPDDAIAMVASQLADRKHSYWRGKTIVHSSGALPASILQVLKRKGARVASAHPMNSFVRKSAPEFTGVPFALEGDKNAIALVKRVVKDLGGEPFTIATRTKSLYHAMGAFASPLFVSLIAAAEEVGHKAGFKHPRKVLAHILRQTTENIIQQGTANAFSGPLKRGDLLTLRKHLLVLRTLPQVLDVYKALSRNAARKLPVTKPKLIMAMMK